MIGALERLVSGGQTGVDRGALEAALQAGVAVGGWCPKGRRAEDGRIPDRYPLRETPGASYLERTERNVLEADATLILCRGRLTGGTAATRRLAHRHGRPVLVLAPELRWIPSAVEWITVHRVRTLNVAGPRESGAPGTEAAAFRFISALLRESEAQRAAPSRQTRSK